LGELIFPLEDIREKLDQYIEKNTEMTCIPIISQQVKNFVALVELTVDRLLPLSVLAKRQQNAKHFKLFITKLEHL